MRGSNRAIPCLGYPSRTAAVHGLVAEGVSRQEIAARIGIPVKTVDALRLSSRASRGGPTAPIHELSVRHTRLLRREVAARGRTFESLCRELLSVIAEDGLTRAILDEEATVQ